LRYEFVHSGVLRELVKSLRLYLGERWGARVVVVVPSKTIRFVVIVLSVFSLKLELGLPQMLTGFHGVFVAVCNAVKYGLEDALRVWV
jgi:hypothetical protein